MDYVMFVLEIVKISIGFPSVKIETTSLSKYSVLVFPGLKLKPNCFQNIESSPMMGCVKGLQK
jgi:hypothetical protein